MESWKGLGRWFELRIKCRTVHQRDVLVHAQLTEMRIIFEFPAADDT
jgi:hypothetical protein